MSLPNPAQEFDFVVRPQTVPDGWKASPVRTAALLNGARDFVVVNHLHTKTARLLMQLLSNGYGPVNILLAKGANDQARTNLVTMLTMAGMLQTENLPTIESDEPWLVEYGGRLLLSNSASILTTAARWDQNPDVLTKIEALSAAESHPSWGWIYRLPNTVFNPQVFYDMFTRMSTPDKDSRFWLVVGTHWRGTTPYEELLTVYQWHGGMLKNGGRDKDKPLPYTYYEQLIENELVLRHTAETE